VRALEIGEAQEQVFVHAADLRLRDEGTLAIARQARDGDRDECRTEHAERSLARSGLRGQVRLSHSYPVSAAKVSNRLMQ
jgi:hypothetical protein